jgi:hypothetical protein
MSENVQKWAIIVHYSWSATFTTKNTRTIIKTRNKYISEEYSLF